MSQFGKSQTVNRIEDLRFLTGAGRYIDDTAPADALHAYVLRSPVAHADLAPPDLAEARSGPGVVAAIGAADLRAAGVDLAIAASVLTNSDGTRGAAPLRPLLAEDRVRFVGEPVAVIVAETLAAARDAAELVALDLSEREAKVDLAPGGPELYPEAPGNVAYDWSLGDAAAVEAALAGSAHRVRLVVRHNRITVNSMEPRGAWAEWDGARLHLAMSGQGVWDIRDEVAAALGLPASAVRVTTPDVGGGFGMKAMTYPEYALVGHLARTLGRPVRWMSDRSEAMQSDNAGRDLIAEAELGFDRDLKITAYRVDILSNLGACNSGFGQFIQSSVSAKVLTGVYDIGLAHVRARGIYTNTTQVDAYRGAGRPEAITTLERTIDRAARELGVDPWDLRARNYIRSFPYRNVAGELIDVGDFARVAAVARAEADVAGFPARRAESAARGRLRGLGTCYYIEAILGDPTEGAAVEFHEDGTVSLYVGTQSNGQGHETVLAQFLSDRTGIPFAAIRIVQGDSDRIAQGGGTGGSRSVTVQSNATLAAVDAMTAAFAPFVADAFDLLGAAFDDGGFRAPGSNRVVTLIDAAAAARAAGRSDLLRHEVRATLPGRSYPNGAHLAEVEIDPETGALDLCRYTVADDFGNLMHPRLAEGQVHGGVAQGIGQAVLEHTVHDETGQLLTGSFMDYAMPRATDLPFVRFASVPVPSTANALGMKGCGEAGTVGAIAAVGNAVQDALWDLGVRGLDMPFTPARIWAAIAAARAG
ncbi:MAG: xanthine dehydrogenase family protein molybdopterin-binding subunit [Pseudomonadota bacterium]